MTANILVDNCFRAFDSCDGAACTDAYCKQLDSGLYCTGPAPSTNPTCYSPTQNLDKAYKPGAVGCACDANDAGQCVKAFDGRNVALLCIDDKWHAVEDGPCYPTP